MYNSGKMTSLTENVDKEVINRVMTNIKASLSSIVNKYSSRHMFTYHVDKDDEYLLARLEEGKKAATAFYTRDDAKKAIYVALLNNMEELAWLLVSDCVHAETTIDFDLERGIGYGYQNGTNGVFEDLHTVRVMVVKDTNSQWGFWVGNAYPVITKDIQPEVI